MRAIKYFILIFLLFGCTLNNDLYEQIEKTKRLTKSLKCLMELYKEDKNITYRKACEYYGRSEGCRITKEEVQKYLDNRCPIPKEDKNND